MQNELTLKKLAHCDFLALPHDEQTSLLVNDSYYEVNHVYPSGGLIKVIPEEDVETRNNNLPIKMEIHGYISLNKDNKNVEYRFKPDVLIGMFNFFESSLKSIIRAEEYSLKEELNAFLLNVEENEKRAIVYSFFKGIFDSFKYELIAKNEPTDKLPKGIETTNLLSKVWLFEDHLKSNIFITEKELIFRFLYCKKSLEVSNVHHSHQLFMEQARFCARRNFMIELNEIYNFEQNQPYTLKISRGLLFEDFTDLFNDEVSFSWTVEKLLEKEKKQEFSFSFLNEICIVLLDTKSLQENKSIVKFHTFLKENFDENIKGLRPQETKTALAKKRIEELKNSLELFIKSSN
jgi:hypothetical protein